jgi:hypothetical protein
VPDSPSPPLSASVIIGGWFSLFQRGKLKFQTNSRLSVTASKLSRLARPSVIILRLFSLFHHLSETQSSPSLTVGAVSKSRLAPPRTTLGATVVSNEVDAW